MKIADIVSARAEQLPSDIRKLIAKRAMSEQELVEALHCNLPTIRKALNRLRAAGANLISLEGRKIFLNSVLEPGGRLVLKAQDRGDGWTVFGILTDRHKGNKHHRADVEAAAYEVFAGEGVTTVLDAGNAIDGECRFNKHELLVHGMDNQIDHWVETVPAKKGMTTHFITGDDHEGWYAQRECINVGNYMQMKAEKAGRQDLHFIGHVEADIELRCGSKSAVMRIMHPGGGSAYALSYAPQKIVEAFQGGEKPPVLIIGHYHKWDYCFPREVHVISAGCGEDQTMFMRKKKLAAHVGFVLVKLKQDPMDGHITRLSVEWNPIYDRAYYERRFE